MNWITALLQGILLGGTYALSAAGLALVFGGMRLINMAHGDVMVAAAFGTQLTAAALGLHPFISAILIVPAMALAGYGLQRLVLNRVVGEEPLPPLIVTFGLSIILQNVLVTFFLADNRRLDVGAIETTNLSLGAGISVGVLPLIMFGVAVFALVMLHQLFFHTALGRAFRATAIDVEIAKLMGLNTDHVYALAVALAFGLAALSGVFLGIRSSFNPFIGPSHLIIAFEVVVIGGLGSIYGALVGGMLLGIAQTLGAELNPAWQILAGHLVFLCVLTLRPTGLFSGRSA